MLSDLRESGAIEQDADIVIFAYRESYYMSDEDIVDAMDAGERINVMELNIAKNRHGHLTTVKFLHNSSFTSFDDDYDETQMYSDYNPNSTIEPSSININSGGDDDQPF